MAKKTTKKKQNVQHWVSEIFCDLYDSLENSNMPQGGTFGDTSTWVPVVIR